jgi:hypothetical protein
MVVLRIGSQRETSADKRAGANVFGDKMWSITERFLASFVSTIWTCGEVSFAEDKPRLSTHRGGHGGVIAEYCDFIPFCRVVVRTPWKDHLLSAPS